MPPIFQVFAKLPHNYFFKTKTLNILSREFEKAPMKKRERTEEKITFAQKFTQLHTTSSVLVTLVFFQPLLTP